MVTVATHNANVELPKEQPVHLTWEVPHLEWEVPFQQQVTLPVEQQAHLIWEVFPVKFKVRLMRESRPRRGRLHVGAANQETQSRAVHVGAAAFPAGGANETQLRAVHVGAANQETQLQTVGQDMADVAVLEHPHPHEDEEHVEWEHLDKEYFDEDDGKALDSARWRSWENSVLVNRATVRRRERCGQHGGVTDGWVTQCEADWWLRQPTVAEGKPVDETRQ